MLNTILYNWQEGINNEVNKRRSNTTTATAATTARLSIGDNAYAAAANNDSLFDTKIDLITEGIDSFFASKIRELSKDNALTIVNYILSMRNEINLSDGYRRMNIYVLYSICNFFNNRKPYKDFARDDVLQYLDSLRKPEALDPLRRFIAVGLECACQMHLYNFRLF